METGKTYSRGEMYSITHTRKDRTFVSEEAKKISEKLDALMDDPSFTKDPYTEVFGNEHGGYVRGMGLGVLPTQFKSSSKTSFASGSAAEIEKLKLQLQESNARVQALEQEVANNPRVRDLEEKMAFIMQNFAGQFPQSVNQVPDLGSPTNDNGHGGASSGNGASNGHGANDGHGGVATKVHTTNENARAISGNATSNVHALATKGQRASENGGASSRNATSNDNERATKGLVTNENGGACCGNATSNGQRGATKKHGVNSGNAARMNRR